MELAARVVTLELAETFVIARDPATTPTSSRSSSGTRSVIGFGEAAPIDRYDESAESALAYLEAAATLLGDDPFALERSRRRLPPGEYAARAALDGALHDLQGKLPACRSGGCSGCRAPGRRPRGRSGSATRTTWRAAPRRQRSGSGG